MREKPQPISFNDTLKFAVGSSLLIFHNKRNYNNGDEIQMLQDTPRTNGPTVTAAIRCTRQTPESPNQTSAYKIKASDS